jgi:hypothetical protein
MDTDMDMDLNDDLPDNEAYDGDREEMAIPPTHHHKQRKERRSKTHSKKDDNSTTSAWNLISSTLLEIYLIAMKNGIESSVSVQLKDI